MKVKLIAAINNLNGIGYQGGIPWYVKDDMQLFSRLTKGTGNNAIVMGKNTWLSIGKPLPKRDSIVLSNSLPVTANTGLDIDNPSLQIGGKKENVYFVNTPKMVTDLCKRNNYTDLWVIGGQSIYNLFLDLNIVDECVITHIDDNSKCDRFFPKLDNSWDLSKRERLNETKHCVHYYNKD